MKCNTCRQEYSPTCDWRQGRCPGHPSIWSRFKEWLNERKNKRISPTSGR
jgi:hypothetical protein